MVCDLGYVFDLLIRWYERFGRRNLPWRTTRNPWHTLVALVMLRRTTSRQVAKVYEKFIEKYPTPESVLSSSEDEVREVIRPLGMENRRSRLIIEMCRVIVEKFGGKIPCSLEDLLQIPCIGPYTALEILCSACGVDVMGMDTNVMRILCRITGSEPPKQSEILRKSLEISRYIPKGRCRDLIYALTDFGALICRARNPRCNECILRHCCEYYARKFQSS